MQILIGRMAFIPQNIVHITQLTQIKKTTTSTKKKGGTVDSWSMFGGELQNSQMEQVMIKLGNFKVMDEIFMK